MSPDAPCPSSEVLRRSLDPDDPMTESERQRVEAHVDQCDRGCKNVIEALLRGGTLPLDPGGNGGGDIPSGSAAEGAPASSPAAAEASVPDVPGYEIARELGRGGMGVVYLARDRKLNRMVALKMVLAGAFASPEDRVRFLSEAQHAAALRHPTIVQVHEVGQVNGLPYFTLEFVPGGTLSARLGGQPLPAAEAARLTEKLARGVQSAHEHGLVHRDLKPGNVLIEEGPDAPPASWTPKITDFGLARRLEVSESGLTQTGAIVGTPSYMAPEQAAGKTREVSPATDVYALGAILYECLTGRPPFKAATPIDTVLQVLEDEPVPPSRLMPRLSRDLGTICLKCLRKEPKQRYATAAELADELDRFLAGRPILARPVSRAERLWRWCRRNPALAAAAGLAAAAVLAVVVLSVGFGVYQGRAADELRREQNQTKTAEDKAEGRLQDLQEAARQKALLARQSARLVLDQGQTRCEKGDVAVGMLALAHGLEIVPDDAPELAAVIRIDLDAWRGRLRPLRAVLEHPDHAWPQFNPDGKRLLTSCHDGAFRLWDVATSQPVVLMRVEHAGRVGTFTPDGLKVLTSDPDGTALIWDAATGRRIGVLFRHPQGLSAVAFSPDGKTIATAGDDKTARLWKMETGEPIGRAMTTDGVVGGVAFSPNGKTLLTCGAETAQLWNVKTGEPIGRPMTIDRDPLHHKSNYSGASFRPDGKTILTFSRDGTVRLWDAATQQERDGSPLWSGELVHAKFSPDGSRVLTASSLYGSDNKALLWNADTGRPVGRPMPHLGDILSTAFSPDGKLVLTGSGDRTAQLWDADTGEPLGPPLLHPGGVGGVAFSRDKKTVVTACSDHVVRLWDATTGDPGPRVLPHDANVGAVAFRPDGRMMATGSYDGKARRWDVDTLQPLGDPLCHKDRAAVVVFSPDGKALLTASWDGTARLWDAETGQARLPVFDHGETIYGAAFSPDGERVATAGNNFMVRLWNRSTGDLLNSMRHDVNEVYCASFSPDGRCLVTGGYDAARRWDAKSGDLRGTLAPRSPTWSIAFSPDGKTLATGSLDLRARFWDADTGRLRAVSLPHRDWVMAVRYRPDGRMVLTAGRDGTARLWDPLTGQVLGPPMTHAGGVFAAAFSPDGRTVLTGGADHTARLWRAPSPVPGTPERITLWVQVITGMELDAEGVVQWLDAATWERRRQRLEELGGPPTW